jgi:hypothetical protein
MITWFLHTLFNPRLNKIHGLELFTTRDPRPFTRDPLLSTHDTRPRVKLAKIKANTIPVRKREHDFVLWSSHLKWELYYVSEAFEVNQRRFNLVGQRPSYFQKQPVASTVFKRCRIFQLENRYHYACKIWGGKHENWARGDILVKWVSIMWSTDRHLNCESFS